jgi:hypothetical protein
MNSYEDPKSKYHYDKIVSSADQVEFAAVRLGCAPLDVGLQDEEISGFLDDATRIVDPLDSPEWARDDMNRDCAISELADELQRRGKLLDEAYPFELRGNALCYRGSNSLVYELCLCIAQAENVTVGPLARLPRAFERLSGHVLAHFLGVHADWYRLGWPPDGDRPERYREAIMEIHKRTGEWDWDAMKGLLNDPGPKIVKDGGADVVVWTLFPDNRVGNLFLLGQCACGQNWDDKLRDLQPNTIREKWLRTLSVAGQIRFFAVPFHVAHVTRWKEASADAGILLDRARIAMIAEDPQFCGRIRATGRDDYTELIRLVIPEFQADVQAAWKQQQIEAAAPRCR